MGCSVYRTGAGQGDPAPTVELTHLYFCSLFRASILLWLQGGLIIAGRSVAHCLNQVGEGVEDQVDKDSRGEDDRGGGVALLGEGVGIDGLDELFSGLGFGDGVLGFGVHGFAGLFSTLTA